MTKSKLESKEHGKVLISTLDSVSVMFIERLSTFVFEPRTSPRQMEGRCCCLKRTFSYSNKSPSKLEGPRLSVCKLMLWTKSQARISQERKERREKSTPAGWRPWLKNVSE